MRATEELAKVKAFLDEKIKECETGMKTLHASRLYKAEREAEDERNVYLGIKVHMGWV